MLKPSKHHSLVFQVAKQEGSVAATGSLLCHAALSLPQVCPTAFKVAENEEGYVLRYYNMSQENVRISEHQQTILDLLGAAISVHSGLLAPQEIRTELIKKRHLIVLKCLITNTMR